MEMVTQKTDLKSAYILITLILHFHLVAAVLVLIGVLVVVLHSLTPPPLLLIFIFIIYHQGVIRCRVLFTHYYACNIINKLFLQP